MATYYEKKLNGKYQVKMELPLSMKELLWRIEYFRRNKSSWYLLIDSFKPSTTNAQEDENIKRNTIKALDELTAFYESVSTLDGILFKSSSSPLFTIGKTPYWPSENVPVASGSNIKHPVYKQSLQSEKGLQTPIDNTNIKNGVTLSTKNALRVQSADPFIMQNANGTVASGSHGSVSAENIVQDLVKVIESAKMIFTSYGSPYTTERGEDCTRWLFNSRNTAMKAIALMVQECPWLIQAINRFDFFTTAVVNQITGIKPAGTYAHLYGHLESADDTLEDSPRHLLTPLWSGNANTKNSTLADLAKQGVFNITYFNASGTAGTPQNLLGLYCNDTYEANAFSTNYTF